MTFRKKYDVIVIGAGPAGSVAARFAAEHGASVLILERDREPGIPVRCAEGVSHDGIAPFIDIDEKWIATTIKKAKLVAPNGEELLMENNPTGYVLERRLFDTALCNLAAEFGAELLTKADAFDLFKEAGEIKGVKFTYRGKEEIVLCDVVIAADGVESRVGRWAGIKTDLPLEDMETSVMYQMTDIDVDPDCCEFYFGNEIAPQGYLWVFPKSRTSANIGLGIAGSSALKKKPQFYLDQFVQKHYPAGKINYIVYAGIPTSDTLNQIVADHIMLVGDAARQVNPITGGGIVQGMIAGSIAGKVAADAVKERNFKTKFLKRYRKEWNKRLGKTQKTMYAMKEKYLGIKDKRFNNLVKAMNKIPKDKLSIKTLFTEVVKNDPKLVIEVARSFVVSKFK